MHKAGRITLLISLVVLVVLVAGVVAIVTNREREASFRGKPTSEWDRLAIDHDVATRTEAYRALAELRRHDRLRERFDAEDDARAKLTLCASLAYDRQMQDKIVTFLQQLISDPLYGDLRLPDEDMRQTVLALAAAGKAGSIEPALRKWETSGLNRDAARDLLDVIKRSKGP